MIISVSDFVGLTLTILLPAMSFTVASISDDTVVVAIGAKLDFRTASDFKVVYLDQIGTGTRNFILDFTDTGSFDSTGLGSLFTLYRNISQLGGQVFFASLSKTVQYTVQLTHVDKIFRLFPTVDAACEAINKGDTLL